MLALQLCFLLEQTGTETLEMYVYIFEKNTNEWFFPFIRHKMFNDHKPENIEKKF